MRRKQKRELLHAKGKFVLQVVEVHREHLCGNSERIVSRPSYVEQSLRIGALLGLRTCVVRCCVDRGSCGVPAGGGQISNERSIVCFCPAGLDAG